MYNVIYNKGSGPRDSVLEAIYSFQCRNGLQVNDRIGSCGSGDVMSIYSDSLKAKKAFNWKPVYNFDDKMASAWKWSQQLMKEKV
jgi:UDP-glucose 4-epimerase